MLELTRKRGQGVHLGADIFLRVRRVYAGRVELAIDCPREVRILRGESPAAEALGGPPRLTAAEASPRSAG